MKDEELIKDAHEDTGIMILPVCDGLGKEARTVAAAENAEDILEGSSLGKNEEDQGE